MSRKRKTDSDKQKSRLTSVITDIRTIIVSVIAGIILAYIIQDARFAPERNIVSTPTHSVNLNLGSGNVKIQQGQMLVLANDLGVAVARFIFSEDGAAYQWRYKSYTSTEEKSGSGRLYENYVRTPIATSENRIVDIGSSLTITIEDMQATWSFSGKSSGWIYYKSLGVDVLNDSTFYTLDLSSLHVRK
ncbi:MAG: hypothetical protein H6667_08005 [Ardenticatenaceae bacterium]|nr:hypothetical protein [Ardenticatenaceae bacterium]MCB9444663.1 hypothetical protein [Ardenticatenaceae bacterium]